MKSEKEIKKIINNIKIFTVNELKNKGLVSLYLAGTILTEDRTPYSDIDLFGIVDKDFKIIEEENKINKKFSEKQKTLCGGIETRFRGLGIDELNSGKIRGVISKYIGIQALVKQFPYYRLLWGEKINFSKFKVKKLNLNKEKKNLIKRIKKAINEIEKGKNQYYIRNFIKQVICLIRVDAEINYGFNYHPSYKKLAKHFSKEEKHIIHEAMILRNKKFSKKEILNFSKEVKKYINSLN